MFENLACVFVGPNEFLSYNSKVAAIFSDFRVTANAGIHLEESRKLSEEEIEELLLAVEKLETVDERAPTEHENKLIDDIQVHYPEVKYVIKSFFKAEGANRKQRKAKKKKANERQKEAKKRKKREAVEEPVAKEPVAKEPVAEDPYTTLKSAKTKNEYSGWKGFLANMYDFFTEPSLSKSQRLALRRNKKRMVQDLRRNYRSMQKIEKQLEENYGLIEFLDVSLDKGEINHGNMAAFTELIRRDPEILDVLDIPDISTDLDFFERQEAMEKAMRKYKNAAIQVDLGIFETTIDDIEDYYKKPSDEVEEYVLNEIKLRGIDTSKLEVFVDQDKENLSDRIITVTGPMTPVTKVKVEFNIQNKDMHNKSFWEKK